MVASNKSNIILIYFKIKNKTLKTHHYNYLKRKKKRKTLSPGSVWPDSLVA
jgi:hypothetical protein